MRISELSRTSDVPVATIKYYLREGLLPAGRALSRTQADYDDAHVERLRLLRALLGVGGLGIAQARRVIRAIDDAASDRLGVLEAAQTAIPPVAEVPEEGVGAGEQAASGHALARARAWAAARGWAIDPDTPVLAELEAAWAACDDADIGLDAARLDAYADAVERIARIDVASVPSERALAARQVVLGTVLIDPVLAALRRLAQQHLSIRQAAADGSAPSDAPAASTARPDGRPPSAPRA